MNKARQAAGLPALKQKTQNLLPQSYEKRNIWKVVCDALLNKVQLDHTNVAVPHGTYALYEIDDDSKATCKSAVSEWKAAYKAFENSPPTSTETDYIFDSSDTLSFVALYNPTEGVEAECRWVTCAEANPKAEGKALLCLTTPDAFKTKPLFTQQQWEKISTAIKNSAPQLLVPSLLPLAAALAAVWVL
ncbi:hypothetical protein Efla_002170 [Eimeria flavescens]